MITKKDFILLADALYHARPAIDEDEIVWRTYDYVVSCVTDALHCQYAAFKPNVFRARVSGGPHG